MKSLIAKGGEFSPRSFRRPSHAAWIWHSGGEVWVELPSPVPGAGTHVIHVPFTEIGLRRVLDLIHARASVFEPATIGTKASPTQLMITEPKPEKVRLRAPKVKFTAEQRARAAEILKAHIRRAT